MPFEDSFILSLYHRTVASKYTDSLVIKSVIIVWLVLCYLLKELQASLNCTGNNTEDRVRQYLTLAILPQRLEPQIYLH